MDTKKTGGFIAKLRHEKGLTQQALGEQLLVSAKTVSRWENGNYMPPIDVLPAMSEILGVSIDEIIAGERRAETEPAPAKVSLQKTEQTRNADENPPKRTGTDKFTLDERVKFWKRRWLLRHIPLIIFSGVFTAAFFALGLIYRTVMLFIAGAAFGTAMRLVIYNRMMAYVELNAYDGKGGAEKSDG